MQLLKVIWARWKGFAHWLGRLQGRALLWIFYFLILAPFAVGARLLSDPLRLGRGIARRWLTRAEAHGDPMTLARRQF